MNSENKENLSNYQLSKRKPSICSTSLHFSKLITVVQFFRATLVLQWFQLNFGAGNFCGRQPGTSALHMILRLTSVNLPRELKEKNRPPGIKGLSEQSGVLWVVRKMLHNKVFSLTLAAAFMNTTLFTFNPLLYLDLSWKHAS